MDKKERQEAIVAEYLAGGVTLRELARRYGLSRSAINRWVKEVREKPEGAKEAARLAYSKEEVSEIMRLRREPHRGFSGSRSRKNAG